MGWLLPLVRSSPVKELLAKKQAGSQASPSRTSVSGGVKQGILPRGSTSTENRKKRCGVHPVEGGEWM